MERLGSISVEAVHRVSGFVRQREDVVCAAIPVHQDDWWFAVDAPGVGTGPFALRFVPIDPAGIVTLPEVAHVVVTQRMERIEGERLCLGDGVATTRLRR